MKYGLGKAHGKIILIGEHAVVYNHNAIAIPFFATTTACKVQSAIETQIVSSLYTGNIIDAPGELFPIVKLIQTLQHTLHLEHVCIEIVSNIPSSAGMGSSAAIASAVVEAIYQFIKQPLDNKKRFEWVQYAETLAHGNPSGIDALTTTHNNAWLFSKLKQPVPFDSRLPAFLIVGNSHQSGNTKESIQIVKQKIEQEKMQYAIDRLGELVQETLEAYTTKNVAAIGSYLNEAHTILDNLGVSTPKLNEMVLQARENGALGAKLTGGGLGGCIIALAKNKEDAIRIRNAWLDRQSQQAWILDLSEGRYE